MRDRAKAAGAITAVLLLAGCQSIGWGRSDTTGTVIAGQTQAEISATAAGGSIGVGPASAGVGIGVATLSASQAPIALEPPPSLLGSWRLARTGERSCAIELGRRNPVGDFNARTRDCPDRTLAGIGLWSATPDEIALYDFQRNPVARLRQESPGLYQGTLADGRPVTVWR
ncbi:AprI/Inh family metalloprotease inhibitor [Chthonobacter albigriseus]|uniref:AprI/Inh family metalloprotease inhibitor n=1 Tax=Chthonobacter albigriseus TaxID=1683161 RepID=UPI0015EEC7F9|nr:AprI/Inh family metalloprotease inhibitor [Chthonobacter albigriseus]